MKTEFRLSGNILVGVDPETKELWVLANDEKIELNYDQMTELYYVFQELLNDKEF